jgi:hypothetical protein
MAYRTELDSRVARVAGAAVTAMLARVGAGSSPICVRSGRGQRNVWRSDRSSRVMAGHRAGHPRQYGATTDGRWMCWSIARATR